MIDSKAVDRVVVRFAGDSGDGIQLLGSRFAQEAALAGNDFVTLPSYPAEIRAPQGTVGGVSSFQIQISQDDIFTPGDELDALIALNPAALKANIADVAPGGLVIVDTAAFTPRFLAKAEYEVSPLEDGSLESYNVVAFDLSANTAAAVAETGVGRKDAARARNFWALGLICWLYDRPIDSTVSFIERQWGAKAPMIRDANVAATRAGNVFGETSELFVTRYTVTQAPTPAGTYRQITGNRAVTYGFMAAAERAGLQLFMGAYPITPASEVMQFLAGAKAQDVLTFQAEDEIAAMCAAIGASFAGKLAVTATSGPGIDLKTEAIGLALMAELPVVICDVQRGGPSTGMPTKTEQSDLLQALVGRHGDSPIPVIAASTPSNCFDAAYEACRIAVKYRTPVMLLTDAFLANGSEPWRIPDLKAMPDIDPAFATEPNRPDGSFWPYLRDENLVRPWAIPGTPGLEHRVGGLEKTDGPGTVAYDPETHAAMVANRRNKIDGIIREVPDIVVDDPSGDAKVLVLTWGSSWGPARSAAEELRATGKKIATANLKWLNPLPANLGDVLRSYSRVIIPEVNEGQLSLWLRATYLVDVEQFNVVRGMPLSQTDLAARFNELVDEEANR